MDLKRKSTSLTDVTSDQAKRSKIEGHSGEEFQPYAFINAFVSDNVRLITKELYSLKKHLTTKERVLTLLNQNKKCFHALIQYLMNVFNERLQRDKGILQSNLSLSDNDIYAVTKEIISILANMCHLSVLACIEIRDKNTTLIRIYLYFLDKEHLPGKTSILRLIGNLCELKETATMIALNTVLLDKVVNCLKLDEQKIAEQALRILRLLAKRSQLSKSVLRCNGCVFIANYIFANKDKINVFQDQPEILQTLCHLFKFHPQFVAKQFSECSDFVQMCLELLLKFPNGTNNKLESQWLELSLRCIRCSQELRSALGETAIDRILELEQNKERLTDLHCRFLCAFLEDSYFRLHMRYEQWNIGNGALNKILERFEPQLIPGPSNKFKRIPNIKIQSIIFESLCSLHYDDSLEFVIRHPNFIPSVLNHVRCYLDQTAYKCQIEYITPEQKPLFPAIIDQQNTQKEDRQFWPLCKDFSASDTLPIINKHAWSPAMSPSSSSYYSLSPSASPPSNSDFFRTNSSSPASSFLLDDYLQLNDYTRDTLSPLSANQSAPSEVEPDDPSAIDLDVNENKEKGSEDNLPYENELCFMQKLVHNEIRLISHFSHKEERQSIFLINEEVC
uniref:Uncharacterized protein n=1 Tax=Meloidogyne hapla TaxID=6305 RepID=A0A1I8BS48_MELHA